MLLAHGPVGYSVALLMRRLFRFEVSGKRLSWLLFAGFVFGLFPDSDLFYYYPFRLEGSHRELITHSPWATLMLAAVAALLLFGLAKKREKYHVLLWATIVGAHLSHLLVDSIGNGIRWLYPDTHLYGLALAHPFFDNHFFFVSFGIEVVFIAFFVGHLFYRSHCMRTVKRAGYVFAALLLISGEVGVFFVDQHSFRSKGETYYADVDRDETLNVADLDMDGDGILNVNDADANGNGISNTDDALTTLERMRGVWYDPLDGSLLNLFSRLGFFIHSDVVYRAYDQAGIFFITELQQLKRDQPETAFVGDVTNAVDVRRATNLHIYLKTRQLLLPASDTSQLGDLAFIGFQEERLVKMVGVVSQIEPVVRITMVVPTEEVMEYTIPKIEESLGPVTEWGRLSLGYIDSVSQTTPAAQ